MTNIKCTILDFTRIICSIFHYIYQLAKPCITHPIKLSIGIHWLLIKQFRRLRCYARAWNIDCSAEFVAVGGLESKRFANDVGRLAASEALCRCLGRLVAAVVPFHFERRVRRALGHLVQFDFRQAGTRILVGRMAAFALLLQPTHHIFDRPLLAGTSFSKRQLHGWNSKWLSNYLIWNVIETQIRNLLFKHCNNNCAINLWTFSSNQIESNRIKLNNI